MRVNLEARAATGENRRAQTRAKLVDAAARVIADKGREATSIEDIVAEAGVARGTFYNYFPTVDELLDALNTRMAQAVDAAMAPIRAEITDPPSLLAATLHRFMVALTADPVGGWLALRMEGSVAPRQLIFERRFDALFQEGVRIGRFRQGNRDAARSLLFGAFRMAQRDVMLGQTSPDHVVELVALLLMAFGVTPEEARDISRKAAAEAEDQRHYHPVM
ncbi:helix-turn-helix domain-containing protein [Phenylobacterium sp.]|uniref:TetR/AcrR family transcriptional regulator n=1 Tax=Phenylobacterium sp. TaxID=1871053 RepID=UPI00286D4A70|nr:helix-turn-helix domain-containing protein [Phenylobacterium sp.]